MDFFEYAAFANKFMPSSAPFWVPLIIGGICFAVVFVFQALALYTIAKNEGFKHKWMAFLPFFNTYYIGHCSQTNRVLNVKAKVIGLVASIFELVVVGLYVLYFVACVYVETYGIPLDKQEYAYGLLNVEIYTVNLQEVAPELYWAGWCYNYLEEYIIWIFNLVFMFMDVMLLSAFFQTYAPNHSFLYTILSIIIPMQGVFMFTVRKNRAVNYRDYIRAEQERRYRIYRQSYGGNPYNNPYNQNGYGNPNGYNQRPPYGNPYGDEFGGGENRPPEDPFSEFDSDSRKH